jgi:hypothetical protein
LYGPANRIYSGKPILEVVPDTVLLFEIDSGINPIGRLEILNRKIIMKGLLSCLLMEEFNILKIKMLRLSAGIRNNGYFIAVFTLDLIFY